MSNNFWNANTDSLLSKYSGISAGDADAYNAMEALDNEVVAMSRAMSRINSLRNSLNPFHRLPPEIISRCFHILASMEPPMYKEVVSTRIRCRGHVHLECVISLGWIKVSILCFVRSCCCMRSIVLIIIGYPCLRYLEVCCPWGPHPLAGPLVLCDEASLFLNDLAPLQVPSTFNYMQDTAFPCSTRTFYTPLLTCTVNASVRWPASFGKRPTNYQGTVTGSEVSFIVVFGC